MCRRRANSPAATALAVVAVALLVAAALPAAEASYRRRHQRALAPHHRARALLQAASRAKPANATCPNGPDYNEETSISFSNLRDSDLRKGITLGVCDVLKVTSTASDEKCRYDETHPRNRPVDTIVLRGLPSGSNYQNWYAVTPSGTGYLECADGNTRFDVRVRVLRRRR